MFNPLRQNGMLIINKQKQRYNAVNVEIYVMKKKYTLIKNVFTNTVLIVFKIGIFQIKILSNASFMDAIIELM